VGWPGEVVALPGFFELRFHHAAGTGGRGRRAAIRPPAKRCWRHTRKVNRLAFDCLERAPAAPRGHEARSLPAQSGGARLRRGPLPALLGRAHQRRPGGQHSHAGKADPAAEGVRIRRVAEPGRRDRRGLRARAGLPLGPQRRVEPLAPTLARHAEPDEHADPLAPRLAPVGRAEPAAAARAPIRPASICAPGAGGRGYRGDAALSGDRPPVPRACTKWRAAGANASAPR
jgi:hypothetical protein